MIGEIMTAINNYFPVDIDTARAVEVVAAEGETPASYKIAGLSLAYAAGTYVRVSGSRFNDGVYKIAGTEAGKIAVEAGGLPLIAEDGAFFTVAQLAPPREFLGLAAEIEAYKATTAGKAEGVTSESLDNYSYQKQAGPGGDTSWKGIFASRLNAFRKLPDAYRGAWIEELRRALWLRGVYR